MPFLFFFHLIFIPFCRPGVCEIRRNCILLPLLCMRNSVRIRSKPVEAPETAVNLHLMIIASAFESHGRGRNMSLLGILWILFPTAGQMKETKRNSAWNIHIKCLLGMDSLAIERENDTIERWEKGMYTKFRKIGKDKYAVQTASQFLEKNNWSQSTKSS